MKLKNNGAAIIALGSINLIPGSPGVEVGKEWLKHPEVKDYIDKGILEEDKEIISETDAKTTDEKAGA